MSSLLTGLSIALGTALVVIVLVVYGVVAESFRDAAQGYHLILGAKGGKLQLTLNTVFHLSQPIENIPYSFYKEFTEYKDADGRPTRGKYASAVEVAVPYCMGDSYQEFRVVGTTPDLFNKLSYGTLPDGTPKFYEFSAGKNFTADDFRGAVIGAVAAKKTDLQVGDHFPITHGLAEDEDAHVHEEDAFHVVGILRPTGTPNDRAVFVNMEGFYLIADHAKPVEAEDDKAEGPHATQLIQLREAKDSLQQLLERDTLSAEASTEIERIDGLLRTILEKLSPSKAEVKKSQSAGRSPDDVAGSADGETAGAIAPLPENQREVTSVLLLLKNDVFSQILHNKINEGSVAQAVYPSREVAKLFEGIVGHVQTILLILAILVIVVAGVGVMVSMYNSMSDRSREIGIMRALGAARVTVMSIVLFEAILLAVLGGVAGVCLGHGTIGAFAPVITANTGVMINFWEWAPAIYLGGWSVSPELVLIPSLLLLAVVVGYLPAVVAYRTDVSRALSHSP
ncbi:MAG: ABC transporter permease [Pirellulales bacterium]|nr:ABC transporter permease [Pirellulales bacterium]